MERYLIIHFSLIDQYLVYPTKVNSSMNHNIGQRDSIKKRSDRESQKLKRDNYDVNKRRSYSKGLYPQNTFTSPQNKQKEEIDIRKIAEYILHLSLLVFETQLYSSSAVSAACILSARHIAHKDPVWSDELSHKTGYSLSKIAKLANLLLKNYNILQIGGDSVNTSQAIYIQPCKFPGQKILVSHNSPIKTQNEAKNIDTDEIVPFQEDTIETRKPFKDLRKSYKNHNELLKHHDVNLMKLYSTNSSKKVSNREAQSIYSYKNQRNTQSSRLIEEQRILKNSSLIERARTSFKNGINGFLQNTGNFMNHVKKEMAQEDFSFSYPFKR